MGIIDPSNDKEAEARRETAIMILRFAYFGPATEGLFEHLNNPRWSHALKHAPDASDARVKLSPGLRFESWGAAIGSEAQDMIAGVTKSDPAARLTGIDQVLNFWRMRGGRRSLDKKACETSANPSGRMCG
jgi:hypothetical protein